MKKTYLRHKNANVEFLTIKTTEIWEHERCMEDVGAVWVLKHI